MGEVGDRKMDDMSPEQVDAALVSDFALWSGTALIIVGDKSAVEHVLTIEATTRDGKIHELMFDDRGAQMLMKGFMLHAAERIRQEQEQREREGK